MKGDKKKRKFEEALEELEECVGALEGGETDLDKALELFEKGVGLVAECRERLKEAELRLKALEAAVPVREPKENDPH